jgi:5-methyltetrahydropteroyltriglutamate--homocysteine methyltransferase
VDVIISNHSHYPRVGDQKDQLKLRKAYHQYDHKKVDLEKLKRVEEETIRDIIKEQERAKLDIVTDGLIRWNDPVSYFMKRLEGVEIGGLLRFFDTNFYFRQPQIIGKLSRKEPCFKKDLLFLRAETDADIKLVLTGPYTLALLSNIATPHYQSVEEVSHALTDLLVEEFESIKHMGIPYIQIEEPGYLLSPPNWKWASSLLKKLSLHKGNSKLILATYFGDAAPYYSSLQDLPVDILGLDVTYSSSSSGLLEQIRRGGSKKGIQLGLLDGRNTKLESPDEILNVLHSLEKTLERMILTTSCGLEYLSRDRASDKLKLLQEVKYAHQHKKNIKTSKTKKG